MSLKPLVLPTLVADSDAEILPNTFNVCIGKSIHAITIRLIDFSQNLNFLYIQFYNIGFQVMEVLNVETNQLWTLNPGDYIVLSNENTLLTSLPIYTTPDSWNIRGNALPAFGTLGSTTQTPVQLVYNSIPYLTLDPTGLIMSNTDLNCSWRQIVNLATPSSDYDAVNKLYVDSGLDTKLNISGSGNMTGSLNMGTYSIINLGTPIAPQDAANKEYVDISSQYKLETNGTSIMGGNLNMGLNRVINTEDPVDLMDVINLQTLNITVSNLLPTNGTRAMIAPLNMNTNRIINVGAPINDTDAVTKAYIASEYLPLAGTGIMTGPIIMNNFPINQLGYPSVSSDAANKEYVDNQFSFIHNMSNFPETSNWIRVFEFIGTQSSFMTIVITEQTQNGLGTITVNLSLFRASPNGYSYILAPWGSTDIPLLSVDFSSIWVKRTYSASSYLSVKLQVLSPEELVTVRIDGTTNMASNPPGTINTASGPNLYFGGNGISPVIKGIGLPILADDAANKKYVDTVSVLITGINPMLGSLNMGRHKIINMLDPTSPQDAASKNYVDTVGGLTYLRIDGQNNMLNPLSVGGFSVINMGIPINATDGATKGYVDDLFNSGIGVDYLKIDGTNAMTGDLSVGNNRITNLGEPLLITDATNKLYVDNAILHGTGVGFLRVDGVTPMTGTLNMDMNKIASVALPTDSTDVATKEYVDTETMLLSGNNPMEGNLNLANFVITNVSNPIDVTDATNKQYVDSAFSKCLLTDGTNTMLGNLNAAMHRIINVVDPILDQDATTKAYVDSTIFNMQAFLRIDGSNSMRGSLNVNSFNIINVASPINANDGANKAYVDSVVPGANTSWLLSKNSLSNTGLFGTITDQDVQFYRENILITTLKSTGLVMNNSTIKNLIDPIDPRDATNMRWVEQYVANAVINTDQFTQVSVIPVMTSNVSPSPYLASASSELPSHEAFRAFNPTAGSWISNGVIPSSIQIYLGEPVHCSSFALANINDIALQATNYFNSYNIEGSNDGVLWNMLYNSVDQVPNVITSYSINPMLVAPYSYYRFIGLGGVGTSLGLSNFTLYTSVVYVKNSIISNVANPINSQDATTVAWTENYVSNKTSFFTENMLPGYIVPIMTNNTTPAPYVVSSSTGSTNAYAVFDRSTSNYWTSNSGTNQWIQINTGGDYVCTNFDIGTYGTNSSYYYFTDWELRGSSDNFVTSSLLYKSNGARVPANVTNFRILTPVSCSSYRFIGLGQNTSVSNLAILTLYSNTLGFNNNRLTDVLPPVLDNDVATKAYVDSTSTSSAYKIILNDPGSTYNSALVWPTASMSYSTFIPSSTLPDGWLTFPANFYGKSVCIENVLFSRGTTTTFQSKIWYSADAITVNVGALNQTTMVSALSTSNQCISMFYLANITNTSSIAFGPDLYTSIAHGFVRISII